MMFHISYCVKFYKEYDQENLRKTSLYTSLFQLVQIQVKVIHWALSRIPFPGTRVTLNVITLQISNLSLMHLFFFINVDCLLYQMFFLNI